MKFDFSYADYAFKNGRVITVNDKDEFAQAVAVKGNKIVYVGDNEGLRDIIDSKTIVIDLRGRSMTPGFIDSHYHPILAGFFGGAIIDINYPKVKSILEIKNIIKDAAAKSEKGSWIKLWGYDANKLAEKRHVTIEDLDAAAPENPVQCMQVSGHLCVYNTLGLAAGGINVPDDAAKFGPGEVEIINGKLTGMTKDLAIFHIWSKINYTEEEMIDALTSSSNKLIKAGVTSVHDPGECDAPSYGIMQKACREGVFKPREYMMLHSIYGKPFSKRDVDMFLGLGLHTGLGDEHFKIGTCKIMVDGGTSGPSSAMREPYSHDPNQKGILSFTQDEVDEAVLKVNDADCQMTAHAVGDFAVEMMVKGYEKALARHPRKDHRHRIEHCGFADADMVKRIKNLGIIPVVNPAFITKYGSNFNKFYGNRVENYAALRSYIDAGVKAAIGSDAPTADESVMRGIDGCVNRADHANGEVAGESQKITVLEAIRCYTINGAYASFEDNIKGSIEVGKLADLVVLSEDIIACPSENIMDIKVDVTMIDGQIVYER